LFPGCFFAKSQFSAAWFSVECAIVAFVTLSPNSETSDCIIISVSGFSLQIYKVNVRKS